MKPYLILSLTLLLSSASSAQNATATAQKIVQYINQGKDTALFHLFDPTFKTQFPLAEVQRAIPGLRDMLGQIEKLSLVKEKDGAHSFKLTGSNNSMHMVLTFNKDNRNLLSGMLFSPGNPLFDLVTNRVKINTDNPLTTSIDKYADSVVQALMTKSNTPGMSIGVIVKDKVYRYNYGETQIGSARLPGSESIYEIASLTKTFTGTILAGFVRSGKIHLDDRVNKYLPDSIPPIEFNGIPLTIAHLVNHTSGFPTVNEKAYGAKQSEDINNPMKYYKMNHILAFIKDRNLTDTPGIRFRYSNLGYALIGYICERVSGKSISNLYNEQIFQPLGMKRSFANISNTSTDIKPYSPEGTLEAYFNLDAYTPAGAAVSTANDLLKFVAAQFTNTDTEISKDIRQTQMLIDGNRQPEMGLGWFVARDDNGIHYNHSGGSAGFTSRVIFNKEKQVGVVILSNCLNLDANIIGDSIFYYIVTRV